MLAFVINKILIAPFTKQYYHVILDVLMYVISKYKIDFQSSFFITTDSSVCVCCSFLLGIKYFQDIGNKSTLSSSQCVHVIIVIS